MHKVYSKKCIKCGKDFLTRQPGKLYCSAMCEEEADPDFYCEYDLKPDVVCRMCGKHFMQEHINQVYCCDICRKKARVLNQKKYYAEICDE